LRFSEVLGLQWGDIDWEGATVYVRRAVVQEHEVEVKTENSDAPAPLDPLLAELLQTWRRKTEFANPEDWIFASPFAAGRWPYYPTVIRPKDPRGRGTSGAGSSAEE